MKKRILSLLAVALLTLSLLTGCGREDPDNSYSASVSFSFTAAPSATMDAHAGQVEVTDGSGGTMWVDLAEELDPFSMDRSKFSVSNGIAYYDGAGYVLKRGIDVSDHQKEIDWQSVADSGVEFAILRCGWRGYTAGGLNMDEHFLANYEGAKAAGLDVGVYFFSQATTMEEGAEEARFVLDVLEGRALDLPVYFDWEEISTDEARTDDISGTVVTDACLEFCRIIEEGGYEAGVYTYLNLGYFTYELDRLAGLPIWLGDPGSAPEFYYDHQIWQYSFTGSVPGIEGDVDMNVLYVPTEPIIEYVNTEAAG